MAAAQSRRGGVGQRLLHLQRRQPRAQILARRRPAGAAGRRPRRRRRGRRRPAPAASAPAGGSRSSASVGSRPASPVGQRQPLARRLVAARPCRPSVSASPRRLDRRRRPRVVRARACAVDVRQRVRPPRPGSPSGAAGSATKQSRNSSITSAGMARDAPGGGGEVAVQRLGASRPPRLAAGRPADEQSPAPARPSSRRRCGATRAGPAACSGEQ